MVVVVRLVLLSLHMLYNMLLLTHHCHAIVLRRQLPLLRRPHPRAAQVTVGVINVRTPALLLRRWRLFGSGGGSTPSRGRRGGSGGRGRSGGVGGVGSARSRPAPMQGQVSIDG